MTGEPDLGQTLLDRLDLAMAVRLAGSGDEQELLAVAQRFQDCLYNTDRDARWIAALLRLRGMLVLNDDAADVLSAGQSRFRPGSQEHAMVTGLHDVLQMVRDRASRGVLPDGWFLVEAFKAMTRGIARFRNNAVRADAPWDAILYLRYPLVDELNYLLDTFDAEHRFRDFPRVFDRLHPVRQSFRVLWRFARIAPFPDFNAVMAWVAMCAFLLAKGYPLLLPEPQDQALLQHVIAGPPPHKLVQFESRLLATVETL